MALWVVGEFLGFSAKSCDDAGEVGRLMVWPYRVDSFVLITVKQLPSEEHMEGGGRSCT